MATICDIDDTLLRNGTQPIQRVIDYVNALPGSLIIVTGRNSSQRKETVTALKAAGVRYSRLIMNPGSSSETADFKYKVAMKLKGSVNLAIDNNATMRSAYEKAGITTKDPAKLPSMKKFWQI
jgi:hydroxymethylpyrimidine pyrophosphatase-like HAD family hydrolase